MVDKFIDTAIKVHFSKYDYSNVIYKNVDTKVTIICPIHGQFDQTPKNHKNGHGCPKCGNLSRSKSSSSGIDYFISKSNLVHRNKYDYSKSIYVNNKTKTTIVCLEHGEFEMNPGHHLTGHGCPSCSNNYRRTNDEFVYECNLIHNNKYSYKEIFK
jgi:ssDNA-binding Zn-finger/Zn-ribbon topoisomerase 1